MGNKFNDNAARRLVQTTKRDERRPLNRSRATRRGRGGGGGGSEGFWAKLTSQQVDKYSWKAAIMDKATNKLIEDPDPDAESGSSSDPTGYAIEARNRSRHCVIGDFVWLVPCVSNDEDVDCFCFDYENTVKFGTFTSAIKKNFDTNSAQYVELRKIKYDHQTPVIEQSTQVRVFNIYSKDVKPRSNGYIQIVFIDGVWIVTGADCG